MGFNLACEACPPWSLPAGAPKNQNWGGGALRTSCLFKMDMFLNASKSKFWQNLEDFWNQFWLPIISIWAMFWYTIAKSILITPPMQNDRLSGSPLNSLSNSCRCNTKSHKSVPKDDVGNQIGLQHGRVELRKSKFAAKEPRSPTRLNLHPSSLVIFGQIL